MKGIPNASRARVHVRVEAVSRSGWWATRWVAGIVSLSACDACYLDRRPSRARFQAVPSAGFRFVLAGSLHEVSSHRIQQPKYMAEPASPLIRVRLLGSLSVEGGPG